MKKQKDDEPISSSEEEKLAKEELHTWEEIKFGEVAEAPPSLAFKPKVKSGFLFHKDGGALLSSFAMFSKSRKTGYGWFGSVLRGIF